MDSPLVEQILASNPWGFAGRRGGGGGGAGRRNPWAEAIAAAGAGEGRPAIGGFTAPGITPGREMPTAEQNPRMFNVGSQSLSSAPGISGGGGSLGSIGPGLEKLGAGLASGLKSYAERQRENAAKQAVMAAGLGVDPTGEGGPMVSGAVPTATPPPAYTTPIFTHPGVGAKTGAGIGVQGENVGIVYNDLIKAGATPQGAIGAIASLQGEGGKGLDPTAVNNRGERSIGFGQWNGPRNDAMRAFAAKMGLEFTDPRAQSAFHIHELKTDPAYAPTWKAITDPNGTAQSVLQTHVSNYERPKYPASEIQKRMGNIPGLMGYASQPPPSAAPAANAISNATSGLPEKGSTALPDAEMKALDQYQDMQQDAGDRMSANPMPVMAQAPQFGFGAAASPDQQMNLPLLAALLSGGSNGFLG